MNNIILNKFKKTPEEFIKAFTGKFTVRYGVFINGKKIQGLSQIDWNFCLDSIYKKVSHQELIILWKNQFFTCKKNQYKQFVHNIRRSVIKTMKKTIVTASLPKSIDEKIKILQFNKVYIHKRLYIHLYDLKTNKFIENFRPLSIVRSGPKKKDCRINTPDLLKNN